MYMGVYKGYIYTLFDGLAYNTCGYFASCVVFFRAPQGRGKIRVMSKMSARITLNHRTRGLLFHYKKKLSAIGFYFLVRDIQRHPDSVCENDVNN